MSAKHHIYRVCLALECAEQISTCIAFARNVIAPPPSKCFHNLIHCLQRLNMHQVQMVDNSSTETCRLYANWKPFGLLNNRAYTHP